MFARKSQITEAMARQMAAEYGVRREHKQSRATQGTPAPQRVRGVSERVLYRMIPSRFGAKHSISTQKRLTMPSAQMRRLTSDCAVCVGAHRCAAGGLQCGGLEGLRELDGDRPPEVVRELSARKVPRLELEFIIVVVVVVVVALVLVVVVAVVVVVGLVVVVVVVLVVVLLVLLLVLLVLVVALLHLLLHFVYFLFYSFVFGVRVVLLACVVLVVLVLLVLTLFFRVLLVVLVIVSF